MISKFGNVTLLLSVVGWTFFLPIAQCSPGLGSRKQCALVTQVKVRLGMRERWIKPDYREIGSEMYSSGYPVQLLVHTKDTTKVSRLQIGRDANYFEDAGPAKGLIKLHWTLLLLPGTADRPAPVELEMQNGVVHTVIRRRNSWSGVLLRVSEKEIVLQGVWGQPDYESRRGYFEDVFEPKKVWVDQAAEDSVFRIRTGPNTKYSLNLDSINFKECGWQKGRLVSVTAGCSGLAAYVDVLRLNALYDFSGGARPVLSRPLKTKSGKELGVIYAFVDEFDKGGKPVSTVRISRDVKAYTADRVKYDWFRPRLAEEGGVAGVWIDPRTKLVTHIFWSSIE